MALRSDEGRRVERGLCSSAWSGSLAFGLAASRPPASAPRSAMGWLGRLAADHLSDEMSSRGALHEVAGRTAKTVSRNMSPTTQK